MRRITSFHTPRFIHSFIHAAYVYVASIRCKIIDSERRPSSLQTFVRLNIETQRREEYKEVPLSISLIL